MRLFGRLAGHGYIHEIIGSEFVLRSGFWVLGSEPAPTSLIVKRCVEQSSIRLLVLGQSCPCRLWGKIACVAAAGHQGEMWCFNPLVAFHPFSSVPSHDVGRMAEGPEGTFERVAEGQRERERRGE